MRNPSILIERLLDCAYEIDGKILPILIGINEEAQFEYAQARETEDGRRKWFKVTHPGLLEVPPGKKVTELPLSHFAKLVRRKGYASVIRGLNNLRVWNKYRNPRLSNWAKKMQLKLREEFRSG